MRINNKYIYIVFLTLFLNLSISFCLNYEKPYPNFNSLRFMLKDNVLKSSYIYYWDFYLNKTNLNISGRVYLNFTTKSFIHMAITREEPTNIKECTDLKEFSVFYRRDKVFNLTVDLDYGQYYLVLCTDEDTEIHGNLRNNSIGILKTYFPIHLLKNKEYPVPVGIVDYGIVEKNNYLFVYSYKTKGFIGLVRIKELYAINESYPRDYRYSVDFQLNSWLIVEKEGEIHYYWVQNSIILDTKDETLYFLTNIWNMTNEDSNICEGCIIGKGNLKLVEYSNFTKSIYISHSDVYYLSYFNDILFGYEINTKNQEKLCIDFFFFDENGNKKIFDSACFENYDNANAYFYVSGGGFDNKPLNVELVITGPGDEYTTVNVEKIDVEMALFTSNLDYVPSAYNFGYCTAENVNNVKFDNIYNNFIAFKTGQDEFRLIYEKINEVIERPLYRVDVIDKESILNRTMVIYAGGSFSLELPGKVYYKSNDTRLILKYWKVNGRILRTLTNLTVTENMIIEPIWEHEYLVSFRFVTEDNILLNNFTNVSIDKNLKLKDQMWVKEGYTLKKVFIEDEEINLSNPVVIDSPGVYVIRLPLYKIELVLLDKNGTLINKEVSLPDDVYLVKHKNTFLTLSSINITCLKVGNLTYYLDKPVYINRSGIYTVRTNIEKKVISLKDLFGFPVKYHKLSVVCNNTIFDVNYTNAQGIALLYYLEGCEIRYKKVILTLTSKIIIGLLVLCVFVILGLKLL